MRWAQQLACWLILATWPPSIMAATNDTAVRLMEDACAIDFLHVDDGGWTIIASVDPTMIAEAELPLGPVAGAASLIGQHDGEAWRWRALIPHRALRPLALRQVANGFVLAGSPGPELASLAPAHPQRKRLEQRKIALIGLTAGGKARRFIHPGGPGQLPAINALWPQPEGGCIYFAPSYHRKKISYLIHVAAEGGRQLPFPQAVGGWAYNMHYQLPALIEAPAAAAIYHAPPHDWDGDASDWGTIACEVDGVHHWSNLLPVGPDRFLVAMAYSYRFNYAGHSVPNDDLVFFSSSLDGQDSWSSAARRPDDHLHLGDEHPRLLRHRPIRNDVIVVVEQTGTGPYHLPGTVGGDLVLDRIAWIGRFDPDERRIDQGWYWRCRHPRLAGDDQRQRLGTTQITDCAIAADETIVFAGRSEGPVIDKDGKQLGPAGWYLGRLPAAFDTPPIWRFCGPASALALHAIGRRGPRCRLAVEVRSPDNMLGLGRGTWLIPIEP